MAERTVIGYLVKTYRTLGHGFCLEMGWFTLMPSPFDITKISSVLGYHLVWVHTDQHSKYRVGREVLCFRSKV